MKIGGNKYSVYYRIGGETNFKWKSLYDIYTKDQAKERVSELERMGYVAHYTTTEFLKAIGLPSSYSRSK